MLDRIPPNVLRWTAIEAAGLLIVSALVLLYGQLAPGVAANQAPVAWVAAATATPVPATPRTGEGPPATATSRPMPPTATVTASPVPTPTPIVHKVLSGQTLSMIAAQYGVTNDAIAAANNIQDRNNLQVGQELSIPKPQPSAAGTPGAPVTTVPAAPAAPRKYTVEGGDTMSGIAERFGVSTASILKANGLDDADSLKIGQELVIPAQ
jgi:LysM repeat protein